MSTAKTATYETANAKDSEMKDIDQQPLDRFKAASKNHTSRLRMLDDRESLIKLRILHDSFITAYSAGNKTFAATDFQHMVDLINNRAKAFKQKRLTMQSSPGYSAFYPITAQMSELPQKAFYVDAQALTMKLTNLWWNMFIDANQREKARCSYRGVACHPTSVLLLQKMVKCITRHDGAELTPLNLEELLEAAINSIVCLQPGDRLALGFWDFPRELVERVLYWFVDMTPKNRSTGESGRRLLFVI